MSSDQQLSRGPLSDQHDTRLQRIADYLAGSLAKPDKLESVLGSASAGLMGIALQIEAAVAELLSQPEAAGADISRAVGAIDTHLRSCPPDRAACSAGIANW